MTVKIVNSKWLATAASIWIQCSCGASFVFGIYSPALKSTQGYDQSTLDTVSVFKDIGANVGVLSGLLYSAVVSNPTHHHSSLSQWLPRGPWVVHLAGAIQSFVGYFFVWLSVTGIIPRPHVSLMCLFMFLAAHSQTFFNTANVVTAVDNFPHQYSGTIVGIMKGFSGLSGAVLVQVYYAFFEDEPGSFLLMLAVFPSLLTILVMFLVEIDHTPSRDDKKHLNLFSWVAVIIAAYLMFLTILENAVTNLPQLGRIFALIFLLLLLSSPLGIAIKAQKKDSRRLSSANTPLLNDPKAENLEDPTNNSFEDIGNAAQMNVIQAICSMNFWLLFVAMICGMGSGMATINNISQIGESLGYTSVETSTLVSLWSIWNFVGRFVAGYLSDAFLYQKDWPRTLFMCLTLVAMSGGHLVIAAGFPGNLYIGSILVGITFGSLWTLMPAITSDIFGVKNMGILFNTIAIASPVGSYILSVQAIGQIYDKEASAEGNACYGTHCFMLSFLILASVSLFGSLVTLVLFFRTKKFYTQVLLGRLRSASKH